MAAGDLYRLTVIGGLVCLIAGCAAMVSSRSTQSPWWSVAFTRPAYMDVWVETVGAVDLNGRLYPRISSGIAATDEPGFDQPYARGWQRVGNSGRAATGAALPKRLYVRWQSIVGQKTYRLWFDVPQEVRDALQQSLMKVCAETPDWPKPYQATITLGFAPGGVVQLWVWNECYTPVKSIRVQAEVNPRGPDLGRATGYYPLSEESRRYVERWGIPYGSW